MNKTEEIAEVGCKIKNDVLLQPAERTKFIKLVIDLSEHMYSCGGEVKRIEETVQRICTAYGAKKTDVFCITSVIIITTVWEDGEILTQTRRMSQGSRNFGKLECLNALSREICSDKPSANEIEKKLEDILKKKFTPKAIACIGSILAAGGFAVFFGGSIIDALAAALCGSLIFFIDGFVYRSKMNKVVYHIVCSFIVGVTSILLSKIGIGNNLDKVMIGCIMLLIPGINLTAAIEDILVGDTATGTLKIYEAALLAFSIALGFALAMLLFKGGEAI